MRNDHSKGIAYKIAIVDHALSRILNVIAIVAAVCLVLVMLMAVIDVLGSKLFNHSLSMAYEATEMLSVPIVFLAVGAVTVGRGAMRIDLIMDKFPKKVQTVIIFTGNLIGVGISSIIAWRAWEDMLRLFALSTKTSGAINLLQWPFCFILCFGWGTIALGLVFCILRSIFKYEPLPDLSPDQILAADAEASARGKGEKSI